MIVSINVLSLFFVLFFFKDLIGFVEAFLSLHQKPETGFFDATLILIQNNLDLMTWLLGMKSLNAKLIQEQTVKELGFVDDIELIWKCFVPMEPLRDPKELHWHQMILWDPQTVTPNQQIHQS